MNPLSPKEYFAKIQPLRDPEKIQEVCEALTSTLFKSTDKPKTRANKLTAYNKLVRSIPDSELVDCKNAYIQTKADGSLWKRHLHFKFTGLAETNWNGEGGINTKTTVTDRLSNRKPVDPTEYIDTAKALLASNDPHELAVGLIAVTGRRPTEILARGEFELEPDVTPYSLRFRGQLKKRGEATEYSIGCLVPVQSFIEAFNRFRKMPESVELLNLIETQSDKGISDEVINKLIDSRRNGSLNHVVKKHFGFLKTREGETTVNCTTLRAVYVRIVTDRDCPKNVSDLLWASRALGHFVDNDKPSDAELKHLVTTLGYYDYYAEGEIPKLEASQAKAKTTTSKLRQVRVYEGNYEAIKELQINWKLTKQQDVIEKLLELAMQAKDLKEELIETQSKLSETQVQSANESLEDLVKRLVDERICETLASQTLNPTLNPTLKVTLNPDPKPLPPAPTKDWESVPSEELRKSKVSGAADEKIRRSFVAITNFNDYTAKDLKDKWAVNNRALRQLSGAHGDLVKAWMERHQLSINDHNAKHGLSQYHNKRHKEAITDVINW